MNNIKKKVILILSVLMLLSIMWGNSVIYAVEFGWVTDVHWHPTTNPYSDDKLIDFITDMNSWSPDFIAMGGDFVVDDESFLAHIDAIYDDFTGDRHYVFGNHDGTRANWISQILDPIGESSSYYSFDKENHHFIILDSEYSGEIGATQRTWLTNDLAGTSLDTIVFIHRSLTDTRADLSDRGTVRTILENSGKVIAVLNGHWHCNAKETINGIIYYSMDNLGGWDGRPYEWTAYAKVEVKNGIIDIVGTGEQKDYCSETKIKNAVLKNCVIK